MSATDRVMPSAGVEAVRVMAVKWAPDFDIPLVEHREHNDWIGRFVEMERSRGALFRLEAGVYRRLDGLAYAFDGGHIERGQMIAGRTYARHWGTFHDFGQFQSTLEYQNLANSLGVQEAQLVAGMQLRRARACLTKGQMRLLDLVCGLGRVVGPHLMGQLVNPLSILYRHYGAPEDELGYADLTAYAPVVLELRDAAARCQRLYAAGRPLHRVGLQAVLYRAQGAKCCLCDRRMSSREITFEHVVAQSSGGGHGPGNILLSHLRCNAAKGSSYPSAATRATLARVNRLLGWDDESEDAPAEEGNIRLMEALARLERLKTEAAPSVRKKPDRAPRAAEVAAIEMDWGELLPPKPSRSDRAMEGTWLREQGVLRRNRGNRDLGVQAKAAARRKRKRK